jgi:hypothetical protein
MDRLDADHPITTPFSAKVKNPISSSSGHGALLSTEAVLLFFFLL